jgi:uncharacterized protein (TIGR00369 family)
MHDVMPFTAVIGAEALAASADEVRARIAWNETLCTSGALMHAGVLMSLADSVGAWCAFFNLPPNSTTTTIESKTNFLRAVRKGHVEAIARPLHKGRTIIVIDTEIRDDDGKLVARVSQTQAVLPRT